MTHDSESACCRIGVIADVQYCDIDDGSDFSGKTKRCYRGALDCFRAARDWWNVGPPLDVLTQLGDIIDGNCKKIDRNACLNDVLNVLHDVRCPSVINVIGNHELYNFPRETLAELLGTRKDGREYYSCNVCAGIRLVVLNSFELALIGYQKGHPKYDAAMAMLKVHNPNDLEKPCDWTKDLKVMHFLPFNGGFGREQLAWFEAELSDAEDLGEKVIVLSHVLMAPPDVCATDSEDTDAHAVKTLAFDWEEFAGAMAARAGVVLAVFAGHDHVGRYTNRDGVHHLTFQSPLNKGASGCAYGRVDIYADRLEVCGRRLDDFLHKAAFAGREVRVMETGDGADGDGVKDGKENGFGHEERLTFPFPEGVRIEVPAVSRI
eukprot:TRINITY_DN55057_c0_g1_i1.p1 TRINITY_DN55057_c0_g1~~TRINITY_DN55057_c0_g1_i1.p1  ORF type:complete len:377 (-),score=59.53 TRINITY_DN55057_c0_g1_i1:129-1259(-)